MILEQPSALLDLTRETALTRVPNTFPLGTGGVQQTGLPEQLLRAVEARTLEGVRVQVVHDAAGAAREHDEQGI